MSYRLAGLIDKLFNMISEICSIKKPELFLKNVYKQAKLDTYTI